MVTMVERAKVLIENSNRYRFFRGNFYNTGADDFMLELRKFLEEFIDGQGGQESDQARSETQADEHRARAVRTAEQQAQAPAMEEVQ